jgi:molecular chaperone GrpE
VSVEKIEHEPANPEATQRSGQEPGDVTAEREQWIAEKAALNDRLLRAHSDFQNLRRRTEQQRVEVYDSATAEALRALLPVVDDFERALRAEAADKKYVAGIELIYNRFAETLKKLGLEPMDSKGQPFDPQIHHAVDMVETDDAPDHTILEEYERGYNFKGRLLRPAMVKVAVQAASK